MNKYVVQVSKLIEIFCSCDDFVKNIEKYVESEQHEPKRKSTRVCELSDSEIMAIVIFYHLSGFKCFQYYYTQIIENHLKEYFPKAICYARFIAIKKRIIPLLFFYIHTARQGLLTGTYFGDSKKLPVCDNRRIHSNKVFEGLAVRGKTSTGWFYGFKLFLVVNQAGQVIKCGLTQGSIADNNFDFITRFLSKTKGNLFCDRGFISSKIFEHMFNEGLKIITGIRSNMKNKLMDIKEKLNLRKRGVIESIFDILMTICDIDHTRHRSPLNFILNVFAGVTAYTFLDKIPSVANKLKF